MMPQTLYDKIWDEHVVNTMDDGSSLIYIDRHMIHEVTSPQAFEGIDIAGRKIWRKDSLLATADHVISTEDRTNPLDDLQAREQFETLEANVSAHGVRYLGLSDKRQGIVHVVGPEQGFSPLRPEMLKDVSFVVVRELTGDVYFGEPRGYREENGVRTAFNTMVYSEIEIRRIAKVAFETARKRKKRVCSIDKSNVLESMRFWREIVEDVAKAYPDVTLSHLYVDNAAMQIIPARESAIVVQIRNKNPAFMSLRSDIGFT